ncbi:MAG: hypothetical protein KU29_05360 [Sulfurovum sp. FS06-10]|nr:MAG: hypothetical protein KU29_05360 [Sulfurovum sp. FS06-10]
MKNAVINARIESELKVDVENILKQIGLTATQAINVFYQQIKLHNGIPFDIKIPNKTTRKAIEDARAGKNYQTITLAEMELEAKKCLE